MVGWLWSVANIIAARFECVATFSTRGSFSTTLHQEPVEVDTRQLGMEFTACRHRTIPDRPIAAMPNAWASLDTVETYYPPLVSCPPDITKLIGRAETAVAGKYVQLGEVAVGSAVELSGTIITPFGAY